VRSRDVNDSRDHRDESLSATFDPIGSELQPGHLNDVTRFRESSAVLDEESTHGVNVILFDGDIEVFRKVINVCRRAHSR
jgi:hypothetical protein